jgi:uncharacterized membrane protein
MRDEAIAAGAQKVMVGGGAGALYGGLTANDIASFSGVLIALLGMLVHWYYKHKQDRRNAELHRVRLDRERAHAESAEYGDGGL